MLVLKTTNKIYFIKYLVPLKGIKYFRLNNLQFITMLVLTDIEHIPG